MKKMMLALVMMACMVAGLVGCTAQAAGNSDEPVISSVAASSTAPESSSVPVISSMQQSSSVPESEAVPETAELNFALPQMEGLLYVGYSFRLKPYRVDAEGNPDETAQESTYTFASSDEAVGTVDAEGIMYGAGMGTCMITITDASGQMLEYSLTVVKAPPPRSTGGSGTGESGAAGGGATPGTPAAPGTPEAPSAPPADGGGGGTPAPPPASGGGAGQGNPNGGNPNGDGTAENPYDSGAIETPDDGQNTDGISPNW